MFSRHFTRQLQLLTVNKGAEEVLEAAEEVLVEEGEVEVKVEVNVEEAGFGCSCSQIDPFVFLSLIGLTALLDLFGFFSDFTT